MPAIIIDHERYGECTSFESLESAENTIRNCGPDFARTELRFGGRWGGSVIVYDQDDEQVGYIEY